MESGSPVLTPEATTYFASCPASSKLALCGLGHHAWAIMPGTPAHHHSKQNHHSQTPLIWPLLYVLRLLSVHDLKQLSHPRTMHTSNLSLHPTLSVLNKCSPSEVPPLEPQVQGPHLLQNHKLILSCCSQTNFLLIPEVERRQRSWLGVSQEHLNHLASQKV